MIQGKRLRLTAEQGKRMHRLAHWIIVLRCLLTAGIIVRGRWSNMQIVDAATPHRVSLANVGLHRFDAAFRSCFFLIAGSHPAQGDVRLLVRGIDPKNLGPRASAGAPADAAG